MRVIFLFRDAAYPFGGATCFPPLQKQGLGFGDAFGFGVGFGFGVPPLLDAAVAFFSACFACFVAWSVLGRAPFGLTFFALAGFAFAVPPQLQAMPGAYWHTGSMTVTFDDLDGLGVRLLGRRVVRGERTLDEAVAHQEPEGPTEGAGALES